MSQNKTTSLLPLVSYITVRIPVITIGWSDRTTTVVRLDASDSYDLERGVLFAIAKKSLGSITDVMNVIDMARDAENVFKREVVKENSAKPFVKKEEKPLSRHQKESLDIIKARFNNAWFLEMDVWDLKRPTFTLETLVKKGVLHREMNDTGRDTTLCFWKYQVTE